MRVQPPETVLSICPTFYTPSVPPRFSPRHRPFCDNSPQNIHKYFAFITLVWGRGAFFFFVGTLALAQVRTGMNRFEGYVSCLDDEPSYRMGWERVILRDTDPRVPAMDSSFSFLLLICDQTSTLTMPESEWSVVFRACSAAQRYP